MDHASKALATILAAAPATAYAGDTVIVVDGDVSSDGCPGSGTADDPYGSLDCAFASGQVVANACIQLRDSATPYSGGTAAGLPAGVILESAPGHAAIITGSLTVSGVDGWTVRNLVFDGSGGPPESDAITLSNGASLTVEDVTILDYLARGIYAEGVQQLAIRRVRIERAFGHAIYVSGGSDIIIEDSKISEMLCEQVTFGLCRDCGPDACVGCGDCLDVTDEPECLDLGDATVGSQIGIRIHDSENTEIRRMWIHDFGGMGCADEATNSAAIFVTRPGSGTGRIHHNLIERIAPDGGPREVGHGLLMFQEAAGWRIDHNVVVDPGMCGLCEGNWIFHGADAAIWEHNTVIGGRYGIDVIRGKDGQFHNNIVTSPVRVRAEGLDAPPTFENNLYGEDFAGTWGTDEDRGLSAWRSLCDCDAASAAADPVLDAGYSPWPRAPPSTADASAPIPSTAKPPMPARSNPRASSAPRSSPTPTPSSSTSKTPSPLPSRKAAAPASDSSSTTSRPPHEPAPRSRTTNSVSTYPPPSSRAKPSSSTPAPAPSGTPPASATASTPTSFAQASPPRTTPIRIPPRTPTPTSTPTPTPTPTRHPLRDRRRAAPAAPDLRRPRLCFPCSPWRRCAENEGNLGCIGRWGAAAAVLVGCWGLSGCGTGVFACQSDGQCEGGQCEATGFCSFPDAECPSGRRYGALAAGHLQGQCVEIEGSTGAVSSEEVDAGSGGPGTTGVGDGTLALTDEGSTGSSGEVLSEGSSTTGTTGESSTGGDDGLFVDGFDRPDANAIGNDWVEKTPTAWGLGDGQVLEEGAPLNYEDNIVYRPAAEDLRDLNVTIEFEVAEFDTNNHPQLHLRLQHEDLDIPGSVTGYILFVDEPDLSITRQIGGAFDATRSSPLTSQVVPDQRYKLSFTALGEDPVDLVGELYIFEGGDWTLHSSVAYMDTDPNRIDQPGAMGFSGADTDQIQNITYDNFTRTDLTTP